MDFMAITKHLKNSYIIPVSGLIVCVGSIVYLFHGLVNQTKNIDTTIQQTSNEVVEMYIRQMENAYAEGQSDAISGDVRIEKVNDTTVVFVKSPWDGPDTGAKWNQWIGRNISVQAR